MVPPTSSGTLPQAVMAAMAVSASLAETRGGIAFFRADDVDQRVRETGQRLAVGLGGADVHVAVTSANRR